MASEPTILGCPVVNGRAETPMGVVTLLGTASGRTIAWWVPLGCEGLHYMILAPMGGDGDDEDAIAEADRVLRALYDVGRVAGRVGDLLPGLLRPRDRSGGAVRVVCGTGRRFVLPVPPEMRTALEANAWTYGIDSADLRGLEVRT